MAYTFIDATLLGYQVNRNYLGEGLFVLNTTKNISIEGIFDNRKSNSDAEGVKETYEDITGLLTGIVNAYDRVVVNGYNLGTGKVLSVSFPEENPIRIGKYRYEIEIIENSDFSNMPSDGIYGSNLNTFNDKITELDESFNFNHEEDGSYSYNHDLSIQYYDDGSDLIAKSKNTAHIIFQDDTINLGLIGQFSGYYDVLQSKKNYYSESYDLINKRCNFSKNISINRNYNTNYTTSLSHSLSLEANGKITVQEEGVIKALDNTLGYTAENYFQAELNKSYSRCQSIFDSYSEKYNLGIKDSLYNQPFSLGKTFNIIDNSLQYQVSYVNDPSFEGNIINTYTINVDRDVEDLISYTEQGTLTQVGQIGTITNLSLIKTKYQAAKTRASTEYPALKLKNTSFSAGSLSNNSSIVYNNQFSYSIERTSDNSIIENDPNYKSLSIKINDQAPYNLYKEYIIANREPKNILFVSGNQVEMGARSVTVEGTLVRPTVNPWLSPIAFPLTDLKSKAISGALNLVSDEAFIDTISYNYNSDNNFSFNLNLKYLKVE
jgi:hypothetical protein